MSHHGPATIALTAALGLLLTDCGQDHETHQPSPAGSPVAEATAPTGIEVLRPRVTLLPGGNGAIYLEVVNGSAQDDRLLRIETPAAEAAELHESVHENGVMRMRHRPDGFALEAGTTLALEPGGKHVMLMGATAEEGAGELEVTLHFETADPVVVAATQVDPSEAASQHHVE